MTATDPYTIHYPQPYQPPAYWPPYIEWKGVYCDHCFCGRTNDGGYFAPDGDHDKCCMCNTRRKRAPAAPLPGTEGNE